VAGLVAPNGADAVFIDGDPAMTERDCNNYWPLVRRGGFLAMHDISTVRSTAWAALSQGRRCETAEAAPGLLFGVGLIWKD
jgi:predicted O-methyltransferase YrrM